MPTPIVWRAALLGAATGARSLTPLAAQARRAAGPWPARLITVAAAGEMVTDKLPGTGSRLGTAQLLGRLGLGALGGVVLARRSGVGVLLPALTAIAATGAASLAGAAYRDAAARRGLGFPAALAEDGCALFLAEAAAGRR